VRRIPDELGRFILGQVDGVEKMLRPSHLTADRGHRKIRVGKPRRR